MNQNHKLKQLKLLRISLFLLIMGCTPFKSLALSSAINYQGSITVAGNPQTTALDFRFQLFDAPAGGTSLGLLDKINTPVLNGFFDVDLDFGPQVFAQGLDRWLEISVSKPGLNSFTTLSPRQALLPVPYAQFALTPAGPQGPQGPAGINGPQGPAGPLGPQGPKGDKGDNGPQGPMGVSGPAGPAGAQGPQGLKGDQGLAGLQGPAGPAGINGPQGAAGAAGPQGPKGDKGDNGPQGPMGAAGPTGPAGAQGPQGLKGNQGLAGPQGSTGPAGATGPQGPQGIKGDTGPAGIQGPAGVPGPQGLKGDRGIAGPQGLVGPTGITGPKGATGPQGIKGDTGPAGIQGSAGVPGLQGLKGDQGIAGPEGLVGPAGITGPKGATGPTGPAGIEGLPGPVGPSGPGFKWTGLWEAADSYVLGDVVTYNGSSWIATLANVGITPAVSGTEWGLLVEQGDAGAPGVQGEPGPAGPIGPQGLVGPAGPQGMEGSVGPMGPIGPQGPQGEPGPQGLPGSLDGWSRSGNTGTTANDFIGTIDDAPLNFRVNSNQTLRLESVFRPISQQYPISSDAVNLIAGSRLNTVSSGVVGGTVSGGGEISKSGFGTINSPNRVTDDFGTIAGGAGNQAGDGDDTPNNAYYATVGGGILNLAKGSFSSVSGGGYNYAAGQYATIPGGGENEANGNYALAAGHRAKANQPGSFVWADSKDEDFTAQTSNAFLIRARGGVGIGTESPQATLHVSRATVTLIGGIPPHMLIEEKNDKPALIQMKTLTAGTARFLYDTDGLAIQVNGHGMLVDPTGSVTTDGFVKGLVFISTSDRNAKTNIESVAPAQVLERLCDMPIYAWDYKDDLKGGHHLGPMAQDFQAAFSLGKDDKGIATVDADGVAFAAIQGLNQKLKHELEDRDQRIASLEKRLNELSELLISQVDTRRAATK